MRIDLVIYNELINKYLEIKNESEESNINFIITIYCSIATSYIRDKHTNIIILNNIQIMFKRLK